MNKFYALVATIVLSVGANINAQILEPGNVTADLYYGLTNTNTKIATLFTVGEVFDADNIKESYFGPIGLRTEYMVGESFSLGLDVAYTSGKVTWTQKFSDFDPNNGNPLPDKIYDYVFKTSKIGVMLTGNYHFVNTEKFDLYGTLGLGYGKRTSSLVSPNDPNFDINNYFFISGFPIASRLAIGARYFFTPFLGASVNVGAGQGGLANLGLCYKIN